MANITNEQWQVLVNVIGAVETGDNVYGQRDYACYVNAYTNSTIETSITIGAFQEYNASAKSLLTEIKNTHPAIFARYDDAGILGDLGLSTWTGYNPAKGSAKAKAIVNIINTPEGREIQDIRLIRQMKTYISYTESKGVTEIPALFECCNIVHQGGYAALDRVLAKTAKPYTLDNIYAALCTDNVPNQVGMYKNRQKLVYQSLKQYIPQNSGTIVFDPGISPEQIINIMRGWLGLSRANGTHKPIVDLYNSYLPHPRSYVASYTDDFCAITVSAAFIKASAVDIIGGIECSVERMIEDCFKPKGIWLEDEKITPNPGDIICYNWQGGNPNTGWADHVGIVEYVDNGMIHTIEGNTSGGVVARKEYPVGSSVIRGFARPLYNQVKTYTEQSVNAPQEEEPLLIIPDEPGVVIIEEQPVVEVIPNEPGVTLIEDDDRMLKKPMVGPDVKEMQSLLLSCGYNLGDYADDGELGECTEKALKQYQKEHGLDVDGVYGPKTKKALKESARNAAKEGYPVDMHTAKSPYSYLREKASGSSKCVKKIKIGNKVVVTDSTVNKAGNKWLAANFAGKSGWVTAKSLHF